MKTMVMLILLGAGGCMTVRAATSPGADLGQYHSFAFYHPVAETNAQRAFEQSPAGQVVQDRIAADLQRRGMVEDAQRPDVLVAYHGRLQNKVDVTDWGYGGFYFGPGFYSVDEYTQGTLLIDFIDPRSNRVVWRGSASAVVDHPEAPNVAKLASAVDKIMKQYPTVVAFEPRSAM